VTSATKSQRSEIDEEEKKGYEIGQASDENESPQKYERILDSLKSEEKITPEKTEKIVEEQKV
jgi:hypothetical protein